MVALCVESASNQDFSTSVYIFTKVMDPRSEYLRDLDRCVKSSSSSSSSNNASNTSRALECGLRLRN